MPFEIDHRNALPPDKYNVGESSLGLSFYVAKQHRTSYKIVSGSISCN